MSYKAKIIIFVLAVLLLLPLAATVFLNQIDIKHSIESYVQSKTGRVLTIEGNLEAKWSLIPTVYARQIKFANSPWARTPFAFRAEKLTVSLSVIALLRGELKITAVELDKPQLWIEWLSETKRYNLDLRTSRKVSKKSQLLPDWIAIKKITIRHGEIVYFHKNRDWEFSINHASAESKGENQPVHIEASGEVEKTVVSMAGELGDLKSLLSFKESPATFNGYVGAPSNHVSISGVIQNVFRWYGLNLWVDAKIVNLTELSDLFGFWLPPYRDISAKWEFVQPETARTIRVESLHLQSSAHGLQAYAEGGIGQLIGFNEVDIRFNAKGNLDREIISSNLIQGVNLDTSISGSVFGNRKDLTLDIEHAQILAEGINVNAAGAVSNVFRNWSVPLPLNMKIVNLDALLRIFDIPRGAPTLRWPDMHEINVQANLNHQKSKFALQNINISSAAENLKLDATGEIHNLGSDYMGDIKFDAVVNHQGNRQGNRQGLGQISESRFLALLDELSVAGTVSLKDSAAKLSHVEIHGKGDGINLRGVGTVGKVSNFQDFQMDMQLAVQSLSKLESLAKQKLPLAGPLDAVGVLNKDAEGKFNLNKITATLTDPDLTLAAEGEILALGDAPNINLNIDMRLDGVAPVEQMYPKLPFADLLSQLMPLDGNAQLSGQGVDGRAGGYSLRKIKVATQADKFSGQIHGRIDNLFAHTTPTHTTPTQASPAQVLTKNTSDKQGLPAKLSGKLSLALSKVADAESAVSEIPAIPAIAAFILPNEWSAAMDIIFSDEHVGLQNIDFNADSEQVTLNASGAFSRLSPLQPDQFNLKFDAQSLAAIIRDTRLPLAWDNPAKGALSFSEHDGIHNIVLDIEVAESHLAGEIGFVGSQTDDTKKSYWADLSSKNFDLTTLLVAADKSDNLFSPTPIKLDWLMGAQADIKFSADYFKSSAFTLDDFKSAIAIDDAVLHANMSGKSSRGAISSNFVLTGNNQWEQRAQKEQDQKWHVDLVMKGDDVDFSALTKLKKSASDNAGIFSVNIDIVGTGNSIAEIAGNANGALLLEFSDAKVKNDGLQLIGGDLFLGLLNVINPLSKKDPYLDIECGLIQFDVNQGVAQTGNNLILKTTRFTLIGSGNINLRDEALKLNITSKARSGLGINLNTVAKIIQVGGTIRKPRIETSPKGLIQTGIALGAAVASGGLSLLAQGLYDKTRANADVCRIATVSGETK